MALTEYNNRSVRVTRAWYGVTRGQVLEGLPAGRIAQLLKLKMVEPLAPPSSSTRRAPSARKRAEDAEAAER